MFWQCGTKNVDLSDGPLIMGVLNVTPDSFSDGYPSVGAACRQAERLLEDGADIIDVGGESTRPGSEGVSTEVELERVLPIITWLVSKHDVLISVDTQKPEVARRAVAAGAHIINHVSASLDFESMIPVLQESQAGYVAMHMKDRPKIMQRKAGYDDVNQEVISILGDMGRKLEHAGISAERVLYDPGIGFGKKLDHNLSLMRHCPQISQELKRPILMGLSRKSWLTHFFEDNLEDVNERDLYTIVASLALNIPEIAVHRVHNVKWLKRALTLSSALKKA